MSQSVMTPRRSGRIARIVAGVRPIILRASSPTACTRPVSSSMATTEGSDTTIPRPRAKTSVFAVPRSIANSRATPNPLITRPQRNDTQFSAVAARFRRSAQVDLLLRRLAGLDDVAVGEQDLLQLCAPLRLTSQQKLQIH